VSVNAQAPIYGIQQGGRQGACLGKHGLPSISEFDAQLRIVFLSAADLLLQLERTLARLATAKPGLESRRGEPRMTQKIKPEPVDCHVGQQLRKLRHLRGMSQSDLAQAVGITFQQVQRYENGTNRVSASRLHLLARILKVSVSAFFEGIDEPAAEPLPTGRGAAQIRKSSGSTRACRSHYKSTSCI
jgi:DNA-binding XRE family transcriptional regulator